MVRLRDQLIFKFVGFEVLINLCILCFFSTDYNNMEYNINDHGDALEKKAQFFISQYIPNYEAVWKIYIGNTGKAERAQLPNYSNESKRLNFSEESYSLLESSFIAYELLQGGVFSRQVTSQSHYIEFNASFLAFFSLLGRMHDLAIKASELLKGKNQSFRN